MALLQSILEPLENYLSATVMSPLSALINLGTENRRTATHRVSSKRFSLTEHTRNQRSMVSPEWSSRQPIYSPRIVKVIVLA